MSSGHAIVIAPSSGGNTPPLPSSNSDASLVLLNAHYQFWYTNVTFVCQFLISMFGVSFCAAMLLKGYDSSIYLPIMTGIITIWIPSPITSKTQNPSQDLLIL